MRSKSVRMSLGVLLSLLGVGAMAEPAAAAETDLVMSQTANPQPQGVLTLAVTVRNAGPSPARGVYVRELLNASGITRISHTSSHSTTCRAQTPPSGYTHARRCQIARLGSGQTWTLTFKVTGPTGTPVTARANAGSATIPDPNLDNNVASVSSWTGPVADLYIMLGPLTGNGGWSLVQSFGVGNAGPNTAPNVLVMTDTGNLSGDGCPRLTASHPNVHGCSIGDLAAHAMWGGSVTHLDPPFISVLNRGSFDPDLTNNGLRAMSPDSMGPP